MDAAQRPLFERSQIMALVKYGGGIIQMTGSIAGNTYARNRYGNYVRARTKPTNPKTSLQTAVRNAMAAITTRWSAILTGAQRTAWNLYGSSVAMKNKLGEAVELSGFNQFIRSNVPLIQIGGAPVDAGPTTFELPPSDGTFAVAISEATQLITITFDDTDPIWDVAANYLLLYQGSPQNPQRNFFAGPWRLAGSLEGDAVTPPATSDTIACPSVCTEGQRVWCYARIALADGRISEPFTADCVVAA